MEVANIALPNKSEITIELFWAFSLTRTAAITCPVMAVDEDFCLRFCSTDSTQDFSLEIVSFRITFVLILQNYYTIDDQK